jgi:hypothetical protein
LNDKNNEKYIEGFYGCNNALIDRMISEKLTQFGKSHLNDEIHDEFKRVFRESKIAPFLDYVIVALKKK